jgi:hypothetical protein
MTKLEFKQFAECNNIPDRYYSLDGIFKSDDAVYISRNINTWEVYNLERGNKFVISSLASEEDAIEEVYKMFKNDIERGWIFK